MRVDLPEPEGPVKRMSCPEAMGRSRPLAMMWRPVSKLMPKWSMRMDALAVRVLGRNAWEAWRSMWEERDKKRKQKMLRTRELDGWRVGRSEH
jgi:hypothetical protein